MKSILKEIGLILATALGLFGAVITLIVVLQPDTRADAMPEPVPVAPASPASLAPDARARAGADLFARNCAHCHGDDAKGDEGPDLYDLKKSDERSSKIIKGGIKGEMPKFESKLNDSDIQSLIAFLRTLKN